jgi:hypothetical protein
MLVPLMNATFTGRWTPCPAAMTTRKVGPRAPWALGAVLGLAGLLLGSGCATPGPLHLYALETTGPERLVRDIGDRSADVSSFLKPEDEVTGFAYDPFTDHFFLRLAPGNSIRVVDRPARAIKREFEIDAPTGRGDLAVRPRDGHLFFLSGTDATVLETSRLGKRVRTVALTGVTGIPRGIAIDAVHDQLLVLAADGRQITRHNLAGGRVGELRLEQPVGDSLAFDAERLEFYAPLQGRPGTVGIFDAGGALRRTEAAGGAFVDVGVRSFVRVF